MSNAIKIAVDVAAKQAVAGFDAAGQAAVKAGSRFEGASDKTDDLASKSGTLTGALGAVGGGLGLIGMEQYAGALGTAATASDLVSGASDLVTLALQSSAVAKAKDMAAMVLHKAAMVASAAVSGVMTAAQWALNAAMSANPIGLVVLAIVALVAGVVVAYKKLDWFKKGVNKAFDVLAAGAAWVKKHWPTLLAILTGPIGIATLLIVKNFDKIKGAGTSVVGWVKSIPAKLRALGGMFGEAGKSVIGSFLNGLSKGAGFVGGVATAIAKAVQGGLNDLIDNLNDLLEFKIKIGPKSFTVNPPDIGHIHAFATGGIVTGPTLGLVGEAGPEAIIPLSRLDGLLGAGGNYYRIEIKADPTTDRVALGRELVAAIDAYERHGGRKRA